MMKVTTTRREFIHTASSIALGAALASSATSAKAQTEEFDIDKAFADFMKDIGGTSADGGGEVTFVGRDPLLRSHFRLGSCMALPAMAAGVGAAAVWKDRTGEGQDAKIDLRESIYNINPIIALVLKQKQMMGLIPADDPLPSNFTFVPGINGGWYQVPWGLGNPLSFATFKTSDDRHVTLTGAYPHLYDRVLNVLNVAPDRDAIVKAIGGRKAEELDEALHEAGGVGGIHRTGAEWAAHPEGKYLSATPLITIERVGDADPIPYTEKPGQPLSGIKALAFTHVIAGSTAARTLAEYGAEVLHIARDQSFEHPLFWADVNVGMRSSFIDLRRPAQAEAIRALLPNANVFIESFRGRSIERLGFGVEEVAAKRPGIVYLSLRCYGWDGPWRDRGGFDMEALTVTGYTMAEGAGGLPQFSESYPAPGIPNTPGFPPTLVLNDYIAGYLAAAGIIAALRLQAKDGGSYHVRVSLARAAMWYASLGSFANTDFDANAPEHRMTAPETIKRQTPYGEIHRLAPQVKLSKTPSRWRDPLVTVRGSDLPVWDS